MRKKLLSWILTIVMVLTLFTSIPMTTSAEESGVCEIDGCTTTLVDGGFNSHEVIDEEIYYHISTAEQLAHINEHLDLNYKQTKDIDLSQYSAGYWTPIGGFTDSNYFTGKYLGEGKRIDNLRIDLGDLESDQMKVGLFGAMSGENSLIDNLTVNVKGVKVENYGYADIGGIVGYLNFNSTISNCKVSFFEDIFTNSPYGSVGGVAGTAYNAFFRNCLVTFDTGSILAEGNYKPTGGIIGKGYSSIINCHVVINEDEMIKSPAVGGIAGELYKMGSLYLDNCSVTGGGSLQLFSQGNDSAYIGGIVGFASDGNIRNCDNEVEIIAYLSKILQGESAYASGIVGYISSYSSIYGCKNTGDVSLRIEDNIISNDFAVREVSQEEENAYAGGITAFINGYSVKSIIENCENDSNIRSINLIPGNRAYAGGIAAHIDSGDAVDAGVTIKNCANLGSDKRVETYGGSTLTGGIVGSSTFAEFVTPNIIIENCYNNSSVYSERNSPPKVGTMCIGLTAGGIIGASGNIIINNTYSTASNVYAEGNILTNKTLNELVGDAYYGGVVGLIYNTKLSSNYCETNDNVVKAAGGIVSGRDIVAESDKTGNYECTTVQNLKTKSFFTSWPWYTGGGDDVNYYDSTNPWRMTALNSYPLLKGAPYKPSTPPYESSYTPITYLITASSNDGGSITPTGTTNLTMFSNKTYTINPDLGYKIFDVLVDGVSVGVVDTYTFTSVTANHKIEVKFVHDCPSEPFSDVDITKWYHEGIDYVLLAGLFKGISSTIFEPNSDMTRAMLVTVLHRLEGTPSSVRSNPFLDVASGIWYTDAITWAAENKIVKGYSSDTFGPNDPITREQMAAILYRYASFKGYDVKESNDLTAFIDAEDVSEWALTAVKWAVAEGLITGISDTRLDPIGNASRAQVATILQRFIENNK